MSFTCVIPDIHGRSDLLRDGIAGIVAHAAGRPGTIVALGDYVNKGPDSKAVIDILKAGPLPGWAFFPLKGNHDAMMVEALRNPSRMRWWLDCGGDTTLASYGGDASQLPSDNIAWLDGLALMHSDRQRIYVHAGLDPNVPLDRQSERTLLSKRYPQGYAAGFDGRHIVHGHDSLVDGPKLYEGRTNLDTRAWRSGRLMIGVFDDDVPGGPIGFIRTQGHQDKAGNTSQQRLPDYIRARLLLGAAIRLGRLIPVIRPGRRLRRRARFADHCDTVLTHRQTAPP